MVNFDRIGLGNRFRDEPAHGELLRAEAIVERAGNGLFFRHYKNTDGNAIRQFNEILNQQLSKYVYEIDGTDKATQQKLFYVKQSAVKKLILFAPAAIGYLLHAPLYYLLKWLGDKLIKEDGHDDSKIVAFLFLFYPLLLIVLSLPLLFFTGCWYWMGLLLLLPFTAWAFVQLKPQL